MTNETTSETLLERARQRAPEAWSALVHVYGPMVYGWARRSGVQHADAADVVQDTFQAVSVSLENFRRDREGDSFRGWLWTITRNKVNDYFRSSNGRPVAVGGEAGPVEFAADAPPPSGPGDESRALLRAIELLRPSVAEKTWDAFWRLVGEGDAPADVAEDLGLSVASVYQAKSRMLRRLRTEFADLIDVPTKPLEPIG